MSSREPHRDVTVEVTPGRASLCRPARGERRVVIDGGICAIACAVAVAASWSVRNNMPVQIAGIGGVQRTNARTSRCTCCGRSILTSGGAVFGDVGASDGGACDAGCGTIDGRGERGADVEQAGSAICIADVTGSVRGELNGSGDLRVTRIGRGADFALNGSGDVNVGPVGGILNASLDGSGDLNIGEVGRTATLRRWFRRHEHWRGAWRR